MSQTVADDILERPTRWETPPGPPHVRPERLEETAGALRRRDPEAR